MVRPAILSFVAALVSGTLAGCFLILDVSELTRTPPDAGEVDADGGAEAGAPGYRDIVIADAPAAYFRLGEDGGPARSEVGDFVGMPVGAPLFGMPGAIVGDADRAFGPSGRGGLDLGLVFDFVGTSPFSFEQWVSISEIDTLYRSVFTKSIGEGATREAYGAYVVMNDDGPSFVFERFIGGRSRLVTVQAPSLGTYHHVVTVFDGASLAVWIDGAERGRTADTRSAVPKATSLLVGTPVVGDDLQPLLGTIDEFAVYTYPLSPERVIAHFLAGRGQ